MHKFNAEPLPIYVKPYDDEVLSSWITRLACSHGLPPYTFISLLLPQVGTRSINPDRTNFALLEKLESVSNVSFDRLKDATVDIYNKKVYWKFPESGPIPWVLPFVNSVLWKRQVFGIQFCPECLSEKPFFRLSHRLAFMVVCPIHRRQLLDRCQHCYFPINYLRKGVQMKIDEAEQLFPFTICYFCKQDIRLEKKDRFELFAMDSDEIDFQNKLLESAQVGTFDSGLRRTPSMEYFVLLHSLAKLYFTTRRSKFFQYAVSKYFNVELPYFFRALPKRTVISSMSVYERRIVLRFLRLMMENDYSNYMDFFSFCNNGKTYRDLKQMMQWEDYPLQS